MTGTSAKDRAEGQNPAGAESEMRLATVMMVDVVESTQLGIELEPEDTFLLLEEVLKIVRAVASAHGGTMINEMGDGAFALFGAPVSIDRASLAACRASLEICAEVRNKAAAFKAQFGIAPEIRVGLTSGEVLTIHQTGDTKLNATGKEINLAARIQSLAKPGTVACSARVMYEAGEQASFAPLGAHELRGFSEPVHIYALTSTQDPATRSLEQQTVQFVGRDKEMARLGTWLGTTDTTPPICAIVGDAGLGKSRLFHEFSKATPGRRLVVGACQPSRTTPPLSPFIDAFRAFAGWQQGMDVAKLTDALSPILPDDQTGQAALVELVIRRSAKGTGNTSVDSFALQSALRSALTKLACRDDVLLTFEDLHWVDTLSAELLEAILADAPPAFRLLATSRPSPWVENTCDKKGLLIELQPMLANDIEALAQSLMGDVSDEALIAQIAEKSEGNPFFATEILNNLARSGESINAGRIGSIQNIALARFDTLPQDTKAMLRMASVQGREFRLDVLAAALARTDLTMAGALEAAEGIIEPDPADPQSACRFHHILFRDAIYATIPSRGRQRMHLASGEALETCLGHDAGSYADQLAEHFEVAGRSASAVHYLCLAADQSYRLAAFITCRLLTDRAFALIDGHRDEFDVRTIEDALVIRLQCLDALDQVSSVIAEANKWLPILREEKGSRTIALLLAISAKAYCHFADFERSQSLAEAARHMADHYEDPYAAALARIVMMRNLTDTGSGTMADSERLFEEARPYTETLENDVLYANRMFHMMAAHRVRGDVASAFRINQQLLDAGERHNRFFLTMVGKWNWALNCIESNDFETALGLAEEGLALAQEGTPHWEIFMNMKQACHLGLGRPVARDVVELIATRSGARGELTTRNAANAQLAFSLFADGRIRDGIAGLAKAEADFKATGILEGKRFFLLHRAELYLTIAGLIPASGPTPKIALGDLWPAIRLRLTATRKAEELLKELLSHFSEESGILVARAHLCLGLIAAKKRRKESAQASFAIAERIFSDAVYEVERKRLAALRAKAGV